MKTTFDFYGDCINYGILLEHSLFELVNQLMVDSELDICHLWRVAPERLGGDVQPYELSESAKIDCLFECLSSVSRAENSSRKRPVRYPGLIRVSEQAISIIENIYRQKTALRFGLTRITPYERSLFWLRFPNWSGIETLRLLRVLSCPSKLRFYWQVGAAIQKKTVRQWQMAVAKAIANEHSVTSERQERIALLRREELFYLDSLNPNIPLGSWRRIQPSIRGRVVYSSGASGIYNASIPFFFNDPVDVKVSPLRSLYEDCPPERERRSGHARAKLCHEPIVKGSTLHHYLIDL